MSAFEDRMKNLTPQQLALLALDLKSRLDKSEPASSEPLAVVGIGCRLPGACGPDEYWQLLSEGKDAISEVPEGRWDIDEYFDEDPATPGKMVTRYGGFVKDVEDFDHDFFGIAKREADTMDPQQRLLLEVAWQTLENSQIDPETLKGGQTGVFVGICNSDFFVRQAAGDIVDLDMYVSTGTAHSVASGRLSYALGLQGPAVSVDTACSSSLVAIHLACQSLRLGECDMALAGGVNLILLPEITVSLSQAGMLSPDGRCKAFDQAANGFVRGEGCGLVALKRLSDAEKSGDHIHAVILGSATNQDGRSHGLTAPNGPAQEAVIRAALRNANISADDITLIEAHGTGTSLGDPIEARALANVFGKNSTRKATLIVGSAKTNIGHAESAAGIAGLIKLILSARHRQIPESLHFNALNPHIEWDDQPIEVAGRLQPWNEGDKRCVGGVSSFGFSGSNAHVIVASVPTAEVRSSGAESKDVGRVLPLSAHTEESLRQLCVRFADQVRKMSDDDLSQLCRVAAVGRVHLSHRIGLTATSSQQVADDLLSLANQEVVERACVGKLNVKSAGQIAFLFPGQGSQYSGMGRNLYECNEVFRACIDHCDEIVKEISSFSVLTAVLPANKREEALVDQTELTQIAIFATEYAMAEMWRSWGVRPSMVIGHSIGEYAAACVAGVFDLEDALKLVVARAQMTGQLPGNGMMAAVFADESRVLREIETQGDMVSIAAINSPGNTVLSGDKASIEQILKDLESDGINSRPLKISNAFHSPAIEPILDDFEAVVAKVNLRAPTIAVVSNVTGKIADAGLLRSPQYWRRHLREPVRFMSAMESAAAAGQRAFLEVGAHPVLTPLAMTCISDDTVKWITTLKRGEIDKNGILSAVNELYVAGVPIDWRKFSFGGSAKQVTLPNYPFKKVRCWPDDRPTGVKMVAARGERATGLVGRRVSSPDLRDPVIECRISQKEPAYLADHRIFEQVILPSPAFIEIAVNAARTIATVDQSSTINIASFAVIEALIIPDNRDILIHTVFRNKTNGGHKFEVFATVLGNASHQWRKYAVGTISASKDLVCRETSESVKILQERMQFLESGGDLYARLSALGLKFGRQFRCLKNVWSGENEALGELILAGEMVESRGHDSMHPALLDGCFHLLDAVAPESESEDPFLLIGIEKIQFLGEVPDKVWAHARPRASRNTEMFVADIDIYGDDKLIVARVIGIELKRAAIRQFGAASRTSTAEHWYGVKWLELEGDQTSSCIDADLTPARLRETLSGEASELSAHHQLDEYEKNLAELEKRSAHYVRYALTSMGWTPVIGDTFSVDSLCSELCINDRHHRLFLRMFEILAEDAFLAVRGDGQFEVTRIPGLDSLPDEVESTDELKKRCSAELTLLDRCGPELANVLQGKTDPMGLLFPKGEFSSVEALYKEAPYAQCCNKLLANAVSSCYENARPGATVRILEIGAGTGGTTDQAIKSCDPERTEYVFTDVSPLFLERARQRYAGFEFMEFALFDAEQSAISQGIGVGKFDLIIASNVLHATSDLEQVMNGVAELLVPDGCLLAMEGTRPTRWVDLTFGYTEGWWKFSDKELRPKHALMTPEVWTALLARCNFESATLLDAGYANPSQEVFFARVNKRRNTDVATGQKWLVIGDDSDYLSGICAGLTDAGATVVHLGPDNARSNKDRTFFGIVVALDRQDSDDVDRVADRALEQTALVSSIVRSRTKLGCSSSIWIATRGAQWLESDDAADVSLAPLWGLARVIALEHPEQWGGIVDADINQNATEAGREAASELLANGNEDQVAVRNGLRFVPRLERVEQPEKLEMSLHADATYLITGGLGGLGLRLGEWLAEKGVGQLALVSRRDFPSRSVWSKADLTDEQQTVAAAIKRMEASGAQVFVCKGSVSDRKFVDHIFHDFAKSGLPIRGVLHCAVAMSEHSIVDLDEESISSMFEAKVRGTMLLDEFSRTSDTDFFVLFSSTTALLGVAGLGHYAAANQFLDVFVNRRRQAGFPALNVNWGTWEVMRVASDAAQRQFVEAGMHGMSVVDALDALQRAVASDCGQSVIADIDWNALKPVYEVRRRRPFLANVASIRRDVVGDIADECEASSFTDTLSEQPASKRRDSLVDHIEKIVGDILGSSSSVMADKGFFDMGMDSLMAVELKGQLEKSLRHELPSTLTFNYPTVDAVADFLLEDLFDTGPDIHPDETAMVPETAKNKEATSTDNMSDAELEDRLAEKLRRLKLK